MRGSIWTVEDGVHRLRVDIGINPNTGKRRQQMHTFRGTRKEAEKRLRDLCSSLDEGSYVEPTKMTLGAWLTEWLQSSVKPRVRTATYVRYEGIIDKALLKASIAGLPLQKIRPSHLEAYYAEASKKLSASTLTLHHAILHRALRKAVRDRLIASNPARDLEGKPRRSHSKGENARQHCWSVAEAQRFLTAAKNAGEQAAAFYSLALDSGMRKGELCGLQWNDVDLEAGKVRVIQQLVTPKLKDGVPEYGPTKTGRVRTLTVSPETIALLRSYRKAQREQMMAHRDTWKDFGLVFTRELGQPLLMNNLGQREYARLIEAAGIKAIKFHGLRHTCATLLLQGGVPVHVVSERLGHSKVSMTMEVYAHVLPDMQRDAASAIGSILHGSSSRASGVQL